MGMAKWMSTKQPGIIFDATNSWNGYNHQGKISIWYAISKMTNLYDPSLTEEQNKEFLSKFFLEIEYLEDFAIGKIEECKTSYISVHQVKNQINTDVGNYESAFLGLLSHLIEYPEIESAVLHTTIGVELHSETLLNYIRKIISAPRHLKKIEKDITNNRNNQSYRESLTKIQRGRPSVLKLNLTNVLLEKYSVPTPLTANNLDEAFDLFLSNIKTNKERLSLLSEDQLKRISIYEYTYDGTVNNFCPVDKATELLKTAIKNFYQKTHPGSYKTENEFVSKSVMWMLNKLDNHIIERDLNYDLYKKRTLDRRIFFSSIYEWLMSNDIDKNGQQYYLCNIKEGIFVQLEKYCKVCKEQNSKCLECGVTECKNKLGCMVGDEFKHFIHVTNPTVVGDLDMTSYYKYLQSGIENPFAKGLRDIPQAFGSDQNAISYKDSKNYLCALTTITSEGTDNDCAIISSEILMNSNIYDLLMDYECLISKDIDIKSINSEEILQFTYFDTKQSEHIAHCKDVKIVPLDCFINSIKKI